MLQHWIWLITRKHISRRQQLELLEHFSDPEEIYRCEDFPEHFSPQMLDSLEDKDLTAAANVVKLCADRRMGILTLTDASYPRRLRGISDPPLVLFYKGVMPDMDSQPVIGVVGTRKATPYGMNNAKGISRQLTTCGGLVVSGGAAGIDTAALEGALEAGKPVVAVLGCGADVAYPKNNKNLFDKIAQQGCIISEYLPGTGPAPWQFPERNRIISGLSDGILVVEAPEKSGALITARDAMNQGREVFAVPGNIDSATCAGSNGLLRDGASAAMSGWDVLRDYAPRYPDVRQRPVAPLIAEEAEKRPPIIQQHDKKDIDNPPQCAYSDSKNLSGNLDEKSRKVLAGIGTSPTSLDDVLGRVDLPATEVMQVLTKLALLGIVENHPGRMVSAKR